MTDPFSTGTDQVQWWHVLLAAITAMWGGIVNYLSKVQAGQKPTFVGAMIHLSMSGFAGLLCWLLCAQFQVAGFMTAICTGLAGHLGSEFIRLLEAKFVRKIKGVE
ncbi:phage holin family protein [Acinetobacter baumannii]|nr:phage holin family protein [Acinetobacter baumannii]ELA7030969.1 phage holin family protein [Acinetobacter baumannii]ELA7118732.1 phage holin family protein [Acinetobacter baumannii]ELB0919681.1 phage holin family protein [Acinetobacter baumannii]ELB0965857.1 phage holin family protein [Acinetobacter baumannii]